MTVFLTAIIILVIFSLFWRYASHRHRLPCPSWLGWLVELNNPFAKSHQAANIIQNLNLHEGMVILDAGCGPGRVTIPLAKELGTKGIVIALDTQQAMLDRVKKKAQESQLTNIEFLRAEIGEGKLEEDKFDIILMVSVLGEIPNSENPLIEIFKALKPEGIFCIAETIFDPHFQSYSKVLNLAEDAGFKKSQKFGNALSYNAHFKK